MMKFQFLEIITYKSEKTRLTIKKNENFQWFQFLFCEPVEEKCSNIKIIWQIFQNQGHRYNKFKRNIASNLLSILLTLGRKEKIK